MIEYLMQGKSFLPPPKALSVAELVSLTGAAPRDAVDPSRQISGLAPLDLARPEDLSFLDNPKYVDAARDSRAGVIFVSQRYATEMPAHAAVLITPEPYHAYAKAGAALYPLALRPQAVLHEGLSQQAIIHPDAQLEPGVTVEAGAVIAAGAEVGEGSLIGPNTIIGPGVTIGRNTAISANVTVLNACIGDHVIIHAGTNIGQDGFGFAMSAQGHRKVVQIGRVIIQNHVEIGAGCCIDRGASRDTIIGEGTKLDNMVQIAHNVVIGRHCVIAAQVGIAGSTEVGDFVAFGGQAGIIGHVRIGDGAQIAAASAVKDPVPAGGRWGGIPAKPLRELARELAVLARLSKKDT